MARVRVVLTKVAIQKATKIFKLRYGNVYLYFTINMSVTSTLELIAESLITERYQLSDIGMTSKVAYDWEKAGVYPKGRRSKFRRQYNGIEYVWLRMVTELREFGLSIAAILKLKDFLFSKFDLTDFIASALKDEFDDQELEELQSFMRSYFVSQSKLENRIHSTDIELMNTTFGILLFAVVFSKAETHLLIKKNGECVVFDNPLEDGFTSSMLMREAYIAFPLKFALAELIEREHLYSLESPNDYLQLSEGEQTVLALMRDGDLNALTVFFENDEIRLIEKDERVDMKEVNGKLVDLIKKGGYQEIQYKTQNGKIVAMNRKTKHKLKR